MQYKIINDTVDILDAVIANFGIEYTVVIDLNANRYDVINNANVALRNYINRNQYDIGEAIQIGDFYRVLQKVKGVIDVVTVDIKGKTGTTYSDLDFDFVGNMSANGRRIDAPQNTIFELKFPSVDIKGSVQ